MKYQSRDIEILSRRTTFGKKIAQVRILATGQILDVPEEELSREEAPLSPHELAFRAMAARIRSEVHTQKMLAPLESNIIPLPHQILALEKVMSGQFLRFLIADEVGMGKTIETGLVLKELKLRGIVKRVLVIVPKSAMLQWKQEMKKHFNENFHIYDSDFIHTLTRTFTRFEADNEINIWAQHNQLIVSMDALKPIEGRQGWSREKVEEYNRLRIESVLAADFDLLIIDECHKVGGSNLQVSRYQMADTLCNAIPNVLLLSATPHRGKSDHFRRILRLLDADAFTGEGMPAIAELEPYVVRTEKRQAIDYDGKPLFNKRRTEKVEVAYDAQRHRKQKLLYRDVSDYVVSGFNLAQQTKNTSYGFVMILFQRMMSSSTQAILDAMEKRAARLSGEQRGITKENWADNLAELGFEGQLELDFEQKIISLVEEAQARYETEQELLKGLIRDARDCLNTETDAKVEFLLEKLAQLKRQEQDPDLKFLIFTEFTSTQAMLKKVLEERGGYLCEAINGSMDFEQRVEALKQFKGAAQVLISTDAAGESLNMQFAHIVINYDMPWNPMVVEQRIGRVDRIGQTHEVIALNLLLDNSIDKRVYEVVEEKLSQIMDEMGIDKTSDVLDSTLERDGLNKLYLTSLLDPARFEQESSDWLEQIKEKLRDYRSTEGALPTQRSSEIKAEKTDAVKYSPLPNWLETMTRHYLGSRRIPCQVLMDGLRFQFPGFKDQYYTFDIRGSLNNPIPEPLSLQHGIIQAILADAVPFQPSQPIPEVRLRMDQAPEGYWSLWQLTVRNEFESLMLIHPVFFTNEGDMFPAFSQEIWNRLSAGADFLEPAGAVPAQEAAQILQTLQANAEQALSAKYAAMEADIASHTERIRHNKEKAFEFQERQLQRIGIENIRQARMQKLLSEQTLWRETFDAARQCIPDLICLLALKVRHV